MLDYKSIVRLKRLGLNNSAIANSLGCKWDSVQRIVSRCQRTALTIVSVTGASGAPEEGLLKVELGDGIMLIPHHLKHRVYPHTRTIPVTDPECRFPIILYRNKGTDNPAADLFYRKMCKAFRT